MKTLDDSPDKQFSRSSLKPFNLKSMGKCPKNIPWKLTLSWFWTITECLHKQKVKFLGVLYTPVSSDNVEFNGELLLNCYYGSGL